MIDIDREITGNFKNTHQIVSFFENVFPIHEHFYYDMKPTGAHERMANKIKDVFEKETGYKVDFENSSVKDMFKELNDNQKKIPWILSYHFREPTNRKNNREIHKNSGDYTKNFHNSIGKKRNKFF